MIARPGTPDAPRDVTVIMRDYRFDPTPIVLVPGETVRLTVLNGGLVEHELTLGDEAVQAAWARADAAATPPAPFATPPPASVPPGTGGLRLLLGSGEQAEVAYSVPESGSLSLVCHLPGHVERGMTGAVELRDAPVGRERRAHHARGRAIHSERTSHRRTRRRTVHQMPPEDLRAR